MSTNLIHFLLPVSFLGWEEGFHLILLLAFLAFPVLCFYYVRTCLHVNSDKALITLPIASFFVLYYFQNILRCGQISTFFGIDLTIMGLIAFERLRENKSYSFFLLTLILSLLFYTHLGMFLYSVMFIFIDFLLTPNRKDLKYICYLGGFLLIISSPFLIYLIKYSRYVILDNYKYTSPHFSLNVYLIQIIRRLYKTFNLHLTNRFLYALLFSLYMFNKKTWKKPAIFTLFLIVLYMIIPMHLYLLLSRIVHLVPFLLSILLAGFLITNYEKKHFAFLSFGLILSFICFYPVLIRKPYIFRHGKPGNFYNRPLVETIKSLEGRYIAVENNQHWRHLGPGVIPNFHWLPLLQLETKKLFFSNFKDGYHHTSYRANSLEGGYFQGKRIDEWAVEDLNKILSKWGIRYLVVWNETTKKYFSDKTQFFEKIWHDVDWIIFKFRNSDIRSAVVDGKGQAEVIDNDFYEKQIMLFNCEKNSRIVVRSNYFPAWKGYYNNKEISVINFEGQIGFFAPDSGNYIVTMKYPRYTFFNILAILALMLCVFLSYKRVLP